MATNIIFNRKSMRAPLTRDDMGRLLLQEARKDMPDVQKALGLLRAGADTDLLDDNGFSALMWAVTKGHDTIADEIIETSDIPEENKNF